MRLCHSAGGSVCVCVLSVCVCLDLCVKAYICLTCVFSHICVPPYGKWHSCMHARSCVILSHSMLWCVCCVVLCCVWVCACLRVRVSVCVRVSLWTCFISVTGDECCDTRLWLPLSLRSNIQKLSTVSAGKWACFTVFVVDCDVEITSELWHMHISLSFVLSFTHSFTSSIHTHVRAHCDVRESFRTHKRIWTSNQARLPAEFKHIIKRRKRN